MAIFFIIVFSIFLAYLIGSVPSSYIFGRVLRNIDIREHGSGNVGATNTFRVLGKVPGTAVMFLDIFKGVIAVTLLAGVSYQALTVVAGSDAQALPLSRQLFKIILGLAAIAGHIWTIFLSFKGGKGVAASTGVLIGLDPITVSIAIIIFLTVFLLSKYVSLGSITAAVCLPVLIVVRYSLANRAVPIPLLIFSMVIAMIVLYRHKANIGRLLRGEENRVNFKKEK